MKFPKYLEIFLAVLIGVLTVFTGVKTWNAFAEHDTIGRPENVRDTITLSGIGKVKAVSDTATVTLGVISEAKTVEVAQRDNTRKMNAIIEAMKAMGIQDQDLKTENYNVYPRYNYDNGKQELVGYQVNQNIVVTVRDLDQSGTIIARAGELGANQIHGLQFKIDNPEAFEAEARRLAIQDARQKAEALAAELGVKVIRVVNFAEDEYSMPGPMLMRTYAEDSGIGGAPEPSIEPGSEEVQKRVSVTFEIR